MADEIKIENSDLISSLLEKYPILNHALYAAEETDKLLSGETGALSPLMSERIDARKEYVKVAVKEIKRAIYNNYMLVQCGADDEASNKEENLYKSIRDNQNVWFRKMQEGLIEVANFAKTNEEPYFRHFLGIREFCTIMDTIEVEKKYFECENQNKLDLCKRLSDQIAKIEMSIDLTKSWYLKERSRGPFKSRKDAAHLRQFSSFNWRLTNVLNDLSAGEKMLIGYTYAGFSGASDSIHWSVGTPEPFRPHPKEGMISAGIVNFGMLAIGIIGRLHKLIDSKHEQISMWNELLTKNEVAEISLHQATDGGIEIGDFVASPLGYGTVIKTISSEFGYKTCHVHFIKEPFPAVKQDQFIAMHLNVIMKRRQVAENLASKWRPEFEKFFSGKVSPEKELLDVLEEAMIEVIRKNSFK